MKVLAVIALTLFTFNFLPASANAYNPFKGIDCGERGSQSSAVCKDKTRKDPLTGNNGALINIANIVAFVAGGIAVIMIVVASIKYITSSGNPEDTHSAKNTIIGAFIGLVVIVLARTLINYVVLKL